MTNPNRFYVYAYLRKDGTPFYIGKGCDRRIDCIDRPFALPPKERRIKLVWDISEEDAFKWERQAISYWGMEKDGGILINKTTGGQGTSGCIPSEETLEKMSKAKKGKPGHPTSPETASLISSIKSGVTVEAIGQTKIQNSAEVNGVDFEVWSSLTNRERFDASHYPDGANTWLAKKADGTLRAEAVAKQAEGRTIGWAIKNGIPEEHFASYLAMNKITRNTMRKWMRRNPEKSALDYMVSRGYA